MERLQLLTSISSVERAAILILAAYGLAVDLGHKELARVIWVAHLEVSGLAQTLGDEAGVEVTVD